MWQLIRIRIRFFILIRIQILLSFEGKFCVTQNIKINTKNSPPIYFERCCTCQYLKFTTCNLSSRFFLLKHQRRFSSGSQEKSSDQNDDDPLTRIRPTDCQCLEKCSGGKQWCVRGPIRGRLRGCGWQGGAPRHGASPPAQPAPVPLHRPPPPRLATAGLWVALPCQEIHT